MIDPVINLMIEAHQTDAVLKREVTDAQWADFGRMVANNIYNGDAFSYALTHAALRSKSTREMLGYIRAYILTGARP